MSDTIQQCLSEDELTDESLDRVTPARLSFACREARGCYFSGR
jgi:hypothetical protein